MPIINFIDLINIDYNVSNGPREYSCHNRFNKSRGWVYHYRITIEIIRGKEIETITVDDRLLKKVIREGVRKGEDDLDEKRWDE